MMDYLYRDIDLAGWLLFMIRNSARRNKNDKR
jgi:hypothetical protein